MSTNEPRDRRLHLHRDLTIARQTLAEFDALNPAAWAALGDLERGMWAGRLAECLRMALADADRNAS